VIFVNTSVESIGPRFYERPKTPYILQSTQSLILLKDYAFRCSGYLRRKNAPSVPVLDHINYVCNALDWFWNSGLLSAPLTPF